jgi:hypothetical protein
MIVIISRSLAIIPQHVKGEEQVSSPRGIKTSLEGEELERVTQMGWILSKCIICKL